MGDQLENQWNELRDSIEIQDESKTSIIDCGFFLICSTLVQQ